MGIFVEEKNRNQDISIRVEHLTKVFGPKPGKILKLIEKGHSKEDIFAETNHVLALHDVSFEVHTGETFVLMGLSGCGKSTLLRCLNRLIKPTSGHIYIGDDDIVEMNADQLIETRRTRMGMVFQGFALLPHRNIIDNIAYGLEIQNIPLKKRYEAAREALSLVGLEGYEDQYPDQLSGGMKQRVGLARALASSPDILLMDEAFSALDPLIRRDMQNELVDLQDRLQKTIIFVTHDLDEALKLGNRIALMREGKIIQIGTAEEILTNPKNNYVQQFVEGVDMAKILTAADVMKQPEPLVLISSGPHVALHMMKEFGISTIYAVGKNKRIVGLITVELALDAAKTNKTLEDIVIRDCLTIPLETPVSDIIPQIAESQYPIAVTGPDDKMKGIIVRGSVLAGLGRLEVSN